MRGPQDFAPDVSRRAYTVRETASILGMSRRWVLYRCADGTLPYVRIAGRLLIRASAVDQLLPPDAAVTPAAEPQPEPARQDS